MLRRSNSSIVRRIAAQAATAIHNSAATRANVRTVTTAVRSAGRAQQRANLKQAREAERAARREVMAAESAARNAARKAAVAKLALNRAQRHPPPPSRVPSFARGILATR